MKNSKIQFPSYFDNNNFKSIGLDTKTFINYTHNCTEIENILLEINNPFLLFVKEGQVKLSTKDKTCYVQENDLIIVNNGNYIMSEDLSEDNNFSAILFFLNDHFLKFLSESYSPIMSVFTSNYDLYRLSINYQLKLYVESLFMLFQERDSILLNKEFLELKTKEFLHYLSKINVVKLSDTTFKTEQEKLLYVMENKWKDHSIKELAFLCHMSISKFKRKFSEIYATTPGNWIKEKKLQLAKRLLLNSKKSVDEVSEELGFKNTRYFSRVFKESFRVTPLQFKSQD